MLVAQVVMPGSRHRSWTVLGPDGVPVEPVERYLAFLTDVDRSPNTVKAYAHDLKDWFVFLTGRGLDWREVRLEDVGRVRGLAAAAPAGAGRAGRGAALGGGALRCGDGEPEAVGGQRVLPARRPPRRRPRRAADQLAAGRAARDVVAPVPAPHQQVPAGGAAGDRVEGAAQAPADPDRRRDAGDPGRVRPVAGPVVVRGAARHRDADRGGAGAAPRGLGRGRAHGHGGGAGQRQRGPRQVGAAKVDPDQRRAGPALRRLPARRVRRAGQRLRVRQPLGRATRPPVDLRRGL